MDASETPAGSAPRIIPDGWVTVEAAVAWVVFGTTVSLDDAAYAGASDWALFGPDGALKILRDNADPAKFRNGIISGVPTGIAWCISRASKRPYGIGAAAHDLAQACERLAANLEANIEAAHGHHKNIRAAANELRRAIAFRGLPAYGWRPQRTEPRLGMSSWVQDEFVEAPRERIPPEVFAAPVTLASEELLPTISVDVPEDGCAPLWRSIFIDAPDLLRLWPAPGDTGPSVLYDPPQPEKQRRRGGAPPKHDWLPFTHEVIRRVALDGVDLGLTDLRKRMKDWAGENMESSPSERAIERKIDEVIPADLFP